MINKNRYTMARSRSITMSDTKDTVDHFITDRFIEIILDHKKTFNNALIIGDRNNFTQKKLSEIGIKNITQINISNEEESKNFFILSDTEVLPDLDEYDLIIGLSLINFLEDIPSFLKQLKNILTKDGLLLTSFFSENNILELKDLFSRVELNIYEGISQRFMPIIDIREVGDLINNIGFFDTVITRERLEYKYENFNEMVSHLRLMAYTNFLDVKNNKFITKRFINSLVNDFEKNKTNSLFKLSFDILIINSWNK